MSAAVPLADVCGPAWASAWGVDEYGVYAEFNFGGIVQRMRWLEPGTFVRGSPEDEAERASDEVQQEVTLSLGYWVADTACTQALWAEVMGNDPSHFKGRDRPVEQVSWVDCQEFLQRINQERPGLDLRLLTESEWEYACRAGTGGPFSFGENITPEQVNYNGSYPYARREKDLERGETVAVGTLPSNGWGLCEMHGNVWEWCADWYGEYAQGMSVNPKGPTEGEKRVLRGGSWLYNAHFARSARRHAFRPGYRFHSFGLRFARSHE